MHQWSICPLAETEVAGAQDCSKVFADGLLTFGVERPGHVVLQQAWPLVKRKGYDRLTIRLVCMLVMQWSRPECINSDIAMQACVHQA